MKKNILKIVIVFVFLLAVEFMFAQTSPPANRPPPPPGLPIDGGLFALLAVGFGYGIKKLRIKK